MHNVIVGKYTNQLMNLLYRYDTMYPMRLSFKKIQSTCSDAAASRGPNQKVISFVVYGDLEAFIDQVVKNMEQVEKFL